MKLSIILRVLPSRRELLPVAPTAAAGQIQTDMKVLEAHEVEIGEAVGSDP